MKATEILRSLISAIVLTPDDTGLAIDVQGDLAGILAIATAENAKNPGVFTSGISQLWIGVQKGPPWRGDRRPKGTPHFDGLDSGLGILRRRDRDVGGGDGGTDSA
ncbi:hypothetical protein SIL82_18755 [Sphingomonas echinoides]|uniref:Uncharacterized protein n=1 Tax=Sphingomonas echinoides TaxID=59803 RepID=A0ABU4PSC2_9SPHN|nr:hypothetical protein [Sphingomonas echinoides]MDX5986304.1 hypothetical protein [Sphingomonas echinoides]